MGLGRAERNRDRSGVENQAELVPHWTNDKMMPPDARRAMSKRAGAKVSEVAGSHAVYVSKPEAVVALVKSAAQGLKGSAR